MWVGHKGSAGWLSAWQVPQLAQAIAVSEQEAVRGHSSSRWKSGQYCLTEKDAGSNSGHLSVERLWAVFMLGTLP